MPEPAIITCPKCDQKLRVPSPLGTLRIKCPVCGGEFFWNNSLGVVSEGILAATPSKLSKTKVLPKFKLLLITGLVLVGLLFLFNIRKHEIQTTHTESRPKWITISYANLLDPDAIIRTGQSLRAALGDPSLKGAVQPFLDQYSYLLQHTIEMVFGPDHLPHHSAVDHYPVGSKQPAWVAIFRGGRILVTTDNNCHDRVFLLGEEPEEAYKHNYPAIRHCLATLVPSNGQSLA